MRVLKLTAQNYRNINNLEIEPCDGANIIYGDNAQGKTNLLESIWLFTGFRSFRGSKDNELKQFHSEFSRLDMSFYSRNRAQEATIKIAEKRQAELNGIKLPSTARLAGEFLAVVFSPVHLSLVKDGPAQRRKFIDNLLCQLKPRYCGLLMQYNHTLTQRNILLKDIKFHSELLDTLDIWDERLAIAGAQIIKERVDCIEKLKIFASDIYQGLSQGAEKLSIGYFQQAGISGESVNELQDRFLEALRVNRKEDLISYTTGIGAHRDDINITVDGLSARAYGSQGQQRSCSLSLKLSEAALIKNITGEQPIALLDDVMSELDVNRQDYILNHIEGWQVFITCCDPTPLMRMTGGKSFELKQGKLINVK